MSKTTADIERVVREVLAELGAAPTTSMQPQPACQPETEGELQLTNRIITMTDIAGRLDSVRRIVVPPAAVVTPAVRDELSWRGIALVRGETSKSPSAGAIGVIVTTAGTDFDPAAVVGALARRGHRVGQAAHDCVIVAVDQLAGQLAQGDAIGVLLTPHRAAAVCLANRLPGVRAVCGADAAAVAAATAAVGANLLVADPRKGNCFKLKQMVMAFCCGGMRPCPRVFRERLA